MENVMAMKEVKDTAREMALENVKEFFRFDVKTAKKDCSKEVKKIQRKLELLYRKGIKHMFTEMHIRDDYFTEEEMKKLMHDEISDELGELNVGLTAESMVQIGVVIRQYTDDGEAGYMINQDNVDSLRAEYDKFVTEQEDQS